MSKVVASAIEKGGSNSKRYPQFQNKKHKNDVNSFNALSNLRIIQRQLVYVIGLSQNLAFKDVK